MSQNKERSGGPHKQAHGRKRPHPQKHQQKYNRQRQPRPAPHLHYESLLQRFTACVDCGYFFTAYRAHHGGDVVRQALKVSNQQRDGWIELPWDLRTSELVHRFFGIRSDTHIDHLEFMCDGCQRKFVCAEVELDTAVASSNIRDNHEEDLAENSELETGEAADEQGDEESVSAVLRELDATRVLRIELKIR